MVGDCEYVGKPWCVHLVGWLNVRYWSWQQERNELVLASAAVYVHSSSISVVWYTTQRSKRHGLYWSSSLSLLVARLFGVFGLVLQRIVNSRRRTYSSRMCMCIVNCSMNCCACCILASFSSPTCRAHIVRCYCCSRFYHQGATLNQLVSDVSKRASGKYLLLLNRRVHPQEIQKPFA